MFFLKVMPVMYSMLAACTMLCTNQWEFCNSLKKMLLMWRFCVQLIV